MKSIAVYIGVVLGLVACTSYDIEQVTGTYIFEADYQKRVYISEDFLLLYEKVELKRDSTFKYISVYVEECDTCVAVYTITGGKWEMSRDTVIIVTDNDFSDKALVDSIFHANPDCIVATGLYNDLKYLLSNGVLTSLSDSAMVQLFRTVPIIPPPTNPQ